MAFDSLRKRNQLCQALALQQLHHDEGMPFVFVGPVNSADVGMVQRRGRARFALERSSVTGSLANSSGRNFSATRRPSLRSSALYTNPIPPPPNISSTRKWETFLPIRFPAALSQTNRCRKQRMMRIS